MIRKSLLYVAACLAFTASADASILFSDTFSYPDGPLDNYPGDNPSSPWSETARPAGGITVTSGEVNLTSAEGTYEAVAAPFNDNSTASTGTVYAGYDINFSVLPASTIYNDYFAAFKSSVSDLTTRGKIFAVPASDGTNTFQIGVADYTTNTTSSTNPVAYLPTDLSLNTTYRIVEAYNFSSGRTTVYVDPTSETGGITSADTLQSTTSIGAFTLSDTDGVGTMQLDNLVVATTFAEVASVTQASSIWNLPGSGAWGNPSSWTSAIPNSVGATASFLGAITSNATVSVTAPETVGAMIFNNSNSYTIAGSSAITLTATSGAATINVITGAHTIQTPLIYTAGLNINTAVDPGANSPSLTLPLNITATGSLTKSGPGTLDFAASTSGITILTLPVINISAGTLALKSNSANANRTLLLTTSLSITGKLDLGNNDMDLQAGGTAGLTAITDYLQQGYNAGNWNGSGIASSVAASSSTHLTALGVILNNTDGSTPLYGTSTALGPFDGTNPGTNDVLVKYTYYGDANLDGRVDGSDYSLIDNGYLNHLTGWQNGDFNYDGVVDGSDYTLIDNAFDAQGASLAASVYSPDAVVTAQIVAGAVAVPEPEALIVMVPAFLVLLGRRARSRGELKLSTFP